MKGLQPWHNISGLSGVNGKPPWNKGKKHSEISKQKMSESHKKTYKEGRIHGMLGKKHSEETKKKFHTERLGKPHPHITHSGEKNSNWKGGITSVHRTVRTMPEYAVWRSLVWKRDNYTCQICGYRSGKINADHIVPFCFILENEDIKNRIDARNCEVLWDVDNGRTLCVPCHKNSPSAQWRILKIICNSLKRELASHQLKDMSVMDVR